MRYNQKATYYHQTQPIIRSRTLSITLEDSQTVAVLIEKETSVPTDYAESIEIDIEEAPERTIEIPVSQRSITKDRAAQIEAWSKGISKGKEPVEQKQGYLITQPIQTPEGSSGNG